MAPEQPGSDQIFSGPERELAPRRGIGRMWQALGLAALVAAVAVTGPDLLASSRKPTPRADGPSAAPTADEREPAVARPAMPPAPLPTWKVRGDLAGKRAFVSSVLDYASQDRPDVDAAVLFAGTLPDRGRVALVAFRLTGRQNPDDPGVEVHALHLRPGQTVTDGRFEFTGNLTDGDSLIGWAGRGRDRHIYAVVVGPPAPIEAEISAVIEYEPSGDARRTWAPLTGRDGSAVVDLGTRTDQIVAVRPLYDRRTSFPLLIRADHESEARSRATFFAFGPEDIAGIRSPSYAGPAAVSLVFAIGEVTQSLFEPAEADLRVIWSGKVGAIARGALVRARLLTGPTFHVFVLAEGTSGTYSSSVRRVPWATADVTPWLLVQPESGKPVLLLNPSGAGSALLEYDGKARSVVIAEEGIAKLAADQFSAYDVYGAVASVFDRTGRRVVSSILTHPSEDDIFVLKPERTKGHTH